MNPPKRSPVVIENPPTVDVVIGLRTESSLIATVLPEGRLEFIADVTVTILVR